MLRFIHIILIKIFMIFISVNALLSENEFANDRIIVRYRSGKSDDNSVKSIGRHGKSFKSTGLNVVHLDKGKSVRESIAELRTNPDVILAEPDYIVKTTRTPGDEYFGSLWGLNVIKALQAWEYSDGSGDIIVAVIDTGVDYRHPDLAANIWVNSSEIPNNSRDDDNNGYADDIHGYDFAYLTPDPMDYSGHGTHCAGTIGAAGNSIGIIGVSPRIKIMPVRFLDSQGMGFTSDAIDAIEYAVANGARILSCSWGGAPYSQSLEQAIDAAGRKGVLLIAAAGNAGIDADMTPFYPACYNLGNIISVGASDRVNNRAYFSNYGAMNVDIFAPGVDILSTVLNRNYMFYNGTSMAAPHISGVAALMLSVNRNLTPANTRDIIISSASKYPELSGKSLSGGIVDAEMSVFNALPVPKAEIINIKTTGGNGNSTGEPGENIELEIEIQNSGIAMFGASGKLISTDSVVQVISGETNFPDTLQGGTCKSVVPFKIRVVNASTLTDAGLFLNITSNNGLYEDTIRIPFYVGPGSIIAIIDDDGGSFREAAIIESLKRLGYNPYLFNNSAEGLKFLASARPAMAIWTTGRVSGEVLSVEEIHGIEHYMDSGGSLVLTGDGWADMLKGDPFLSSYLKLSVVMQNVYMKDQTGSGIFNGISLSIPLSETGTDILSPTGTSSAICLGTGGGVSGTAVYAPPSMSRGASLSIAFDISSLSADNLDSLLHRTIKRLMPPGIMNMTPRNGGIDININRGRGSLYTEIKIESAGSPVYTGTFLGIDTSISGLNNGMMHTLFIRACYSDIYSEWSRGIDFTPTFGMESPLISARNPGYSVSGKGVALTWIKSPDSRVKGYYISWDSLNGESSGYSEMASYQIPREMMRIDDSGRACIIPSDDGINFGPSACLSWKYKDIYPPDEVTGIEVKESGRNTLKISFTGSGSTDVTGYTLDMTGAGIINRDIGDSRQVTVDKISSGGFYTVKIKARDSAGNISQGASVNWGEYFKPDTSNDILSCGCVNDKTRESEGYKKISILEQSANHAVNYLILGMGIVIRWLRNLLNLLRRKV